MSPLCYNGVMPYGPFQKIYGQKGYGFSWMDLDGPGWTWVDLDGLG